MRFIRERHEGDLYQKGWAIYKTTTAHGHGIGITTPAIKGNYYLIGYYWGIGFNWRLVKLGAGI